MPDIEGVPYEAAGTALDVATAQALAARHREAAAAGVGAANAAADRSIAASDAAKAEAAGAKALAQSVVAEVGTIRTAVVQSASSASAAAGSAAQAEKTATDLVPRVEHIETMAGLAPGEVTDAQTANLITQPDTSTRAALNAAIGHWGPGKTFAKGERIIAPHGEQLIARTTHTTGAAFDQSKYNGIATVVPSMTIYETKAYARRRVLYQHDALTMYAVSQDTTGTLFKTTNSGETWTTLGNIGFSVHTLTRVMGTNTLIAVELTVRGAADQNPRVKRSTDDGLTWTQVTTITHPGLGNQGIISPANGVILIAEYGNTGNTVYNVRRSADDGLTWTSVLASPGTDATADPGHIHSIVMDPHTGTLIAFMDRGNPEIYTSEDAGATWTKIGTATAQHHPNWVAPMFFTNHIAWGNDNEADGRVFRLSYADFYAGNWENPEVIGFLNNDRFYDTFPILPDVWVMIGASEVRDYTRVGSWAQEVYLVYNEGTMIAGGLSHSSPLINLNNAMGQRHQLPGYPALPPDMQGRSWVMLTTSDMPLPFTSVPFTVGRSPAMPRTQNGFVASAMMPASATMRWRDSADGRRDVVSLDALDRVYLRNQKPGQTTGSEVRLFDSGAVGGSLLAGGATIATWRETGWEALNGLHINTASGPSIKSGAGSPEGVVTARLGSLYMESSGNGNLWHKSSGLLSNTGWQKVGGGTTSGTTRTIATKTANYTVGPADDVIISDGATIIYLPMPTGGPIAVGGQVTIKNVNATAVSVRVANGEALDGGTTHDLAQWDVGRYINTGTRWIKA